MVSDIMPARASAESANSFSFHVENVRMMLMFAYNIHIHAGTHTKQSNADMEKAA